MSGEPLLHAQLLTIAIGDRKSPPAPNASALGAMPAAIAMVVMTIGRARF